MTQSAGSDAPKSYKDGFAIGLTLKPHRATLINVGLLTLLLCLWGSGTAMVYLGGAALAVAAAYSFFSAVPLTLKRLKGLHPFEFSLIWSPGALSLALAIGAIYIASQQAPYSPLFFASVTFYGVQLAWLVITSAELKNRQSSLQKLLGTD